MTKKFMTLAAGAAIALAPMGAAMAETVAPKSDDTVAMAWVPATQAEQQAARGGGEIGYYYLYQVYSTASLICRLTGRTCFNIRMDN